MAEQTAAPLEVKPLELIPAEERQATKPARPAINTSADYIREYKIFEKKYKTYQKIEEEVGTTEANVLFKDVEDGKMSSARALNLAKSRATPSMRQMAKDYHDGISLEDFSTRYGDDFLSTASEKELTKWSFYYGKIVKDEGDAEIAERNKTKAKDKEEEAQRKKEDTFTENRGQAYSLMVKLGVKLNNPVNRIMDATKRKAVQDEYDKAWGSLQTFIDDPYAGDWESAIAQIYDDVNAYVNTLAGSAPEALHDAIGVLDREAVEYDLEKYESGEEDYPNIGKLRDILANQMLNLVNGFIQSALATADPPNPEAAVKEIKRQTKDGRTAIFNADTKEFIRYE